MLSKKSPRKSCGIGMRNNRIEQVELLNQYCACKIDLESILLGGAHKIFLSTVSTKADRKDRVL
jgi:hypothetical protein